MPFEDEDEIGPLVPVPSRSPAPDNAASSNGRSPELTSPPPVFHPLAYRAVVADWPVAWRERWGRRANALEESGLTWRDAETQAFVEVWNLRRQEQPETSTAADLAPLNAERN
jgi:hypothetical protein